MSESKRQAFGLLILRVGFGGLMLLGHGWGKLANYSQYKLNFADPIGLGVETSLILAIFAEVLCALLLILGIGTRLVAIPLLSTMLVAALIVHANDPFSRQEFPLLYGIVFLTFMITGGGMLSLGKLIGPLKKWS